eukprot:TRINITY_DN21877_c0_g1_i1.p1 TRINITY_DN21877_c0_g1~~TRINITY_DN21877_c0_g1_i1.p1  ORF type:complete len:181 (+),score=29.07 TRINITY_DN21877_c0_g1_i1:276-818(+)
MPAKYEIQEVRGTDLREYRLISKEQAVTHQDTIILLLAALLAACRASGFDSDAVNLGCVFTILYLVRWVQRYSSLVREESLVVIQEFGIQKRLTYASGRCEYKFIAKPTVEECIVNEGVDRFSVVFYLAFVVANQTDLELAFEHFTPRLEDLLPIFHGIRTVLFSEEEPVEEDSFAGELR